MILTLTPSSSLIVDELKVLQASDNAPIDYYYCDYRTQVAQPLAFALSHILRLLVERLPFIPKSLRELFEGCRREGRGPLPSELDRLTRSVLPFWPRCFILVDAMDEFSIDAPAQTAQFAKVLDSLASAGAQVLVTSQVSPTPSLSARHIIETRSASKEDIRSFITHELHADDSMVDVLDNQLESDIINTVTEQA